MRDLPPEVRPRERLKKAGAQALSDADLLAILLGSGTVKLNVLDVAREVLKECRGLAGLGRATLDQLQQFDGIGEVRSIELHAAFELGRRMVTVDPTQLPKVRSPMDAVRLVQSEMSLLEQEQLRVLLLNTKNAVMRTHTLYQGSLNSTTVRIAELFREAVRENAAAVLLVHNHPSGDPTPSPEDVRLTRDAVEAGRLMDVDVLDHVVIGRGQTPYVSLKERGLGFGGGR